MLEAVEAERAAEALALEAKKTWSQAQQATASLRRDLVLASMRGPRARVLAQDVSFAVVIT